MPQHRNATLSKEGICRNRKGAPINPRMKKLTYVKSIIRSMCPLLLLAARGVCVRRAITRTSMARRTPLRVLCVVATATLARAFLSPSCGQHCGGSASSFATTAASATHVASRRCTSSAWRPAAAPARTTRLGDLRMVSHRHVVQVVVVLLKLLSRCHRAQHLVPMLAISCMRYVRQQTLDKQSGCSPFR